MKDKTVAALLAFFLGGLGAHKFYLGHGGVGVLYLLFFWTWIPAIVALFEAVGYLMMSKEAFDAKYNFGSWEGEPRRVEQSNTMSNTQAQNITINMPAGVAPATAQHAPVSVPATAPAKVDVVEQLMKLNELRTVGALTDEEFEAQKQKLLNAPG